MHDSADTIAAISSAVGPAARMIVRMSGPDAHPIAREISSGFCAGRGIANQTTLRFAGLSIPASIYVFSLPHSYTAQDLVEFHIPGNPLLARMLLNDLTARGARHAEPGEFTARAYFAGRIDLTEAEGVAATIAAHGEEELRAARQLLGGELSRRLRPTMDLLAETLALLEAGIDFSDEDISFISPAQVLERLTRIDDAVRDLIDNSARFERLSHESTFVLVGRPNAGKSTLLNTLAGHDRAVVSHIAGTTRDILSAEVRLRRGMIRMLDVAGLDPLPLPLGGEGRGEGGDVRRSSAPPEVTIDSQMMQQSHRALETADYVILLRDACDNRPAIEMARKPDLLVLSKSDLAPQTTDAHLRISAVTGEGMEALREQLDRLAFGRQAGSSTLALNARHLQALGEARVALDRVRQALDAGAEVVALEVRDALDALGRVLGQVSPDDLLGRIFSTFCIGK